MEDRITLSDDLIKRRVGGEMFVLAGDSKVHWLENSTASTIWDELERAGDSGSTPNEIARAITTKFAVSLEQAQADVVGFIHQLVSAGLARTD